MSAADQSIFFSLSGTLPSEDDPPTEFLSANSFLTLSLIYGVTTAPSLVTATATDPDPFLKISLTGAQGTSPGALSAELSACLVLAEY